MPRSLAEFMASAFGRGCEASIVEMAELFAIPLTEHPFEISLAVQGELNKYGLVLVPALPKGSLESNRFVTSAQIERSPEQVLAEIQLGEGPTGEFKSTFMYDVERARVGQHASAQDLKSETVIHSSLKSVAAFLNTSGGVLLVGVADDGSIHGIEPDFQFCGDRPNRDGWESELRQRIEGRFLDGRSVNNVIAIDFWEIEQKLVARVQVAPRREVSYLKGKGGAFEVYVRQGNQSVSLSMPEFAEFLRARGSQ